MSKKSVVIPALALLIITACNGNAPTSAPEGNTVETLVAGTLAAVTQAAENSAGEDLSATPQADETEASAPSEIEAENVVSFEEMRIAVGFDFPDGILQGANTSVQLVYENPGPTELPYPQHARILFTSYTNGSEDHTTSGIRVYRVDEINALQAGVVENLFAVLEGQADHHTDFPRFSGAGALIDAQLVEVPFQNGRGYRYLFTTSFAAEMVNSTGVTMLYQGVTADEKYFVSFIIPIQAPFLSEFIGVPLAATSEEFSIYYQQVNERINAASPDEFTPSLSAVDELISSIVVVEK